ncbi:MAG: delta-60 repeat domain-containing protein [Terrimicrobiaceae bacterium]|nr:delta-60 repeat domain-containing protein [Terrimicrobiaceae bacterium]
MKISNALSVLATCVFAAGAAWGQSGLPAWSAGEGVNGPVAALAVQTDGKILIGGLFSAVNGVPRQNIARLNPDGTLDDAFSQQGINGKVLALAIRPGGGFVAGGEFNQALGAECLNLAVFGSDGSLDTAFHPPGQPGTNGPVQAVAVQPDGAILIGGIFTSAGGQPRQNIARFRPDGSLDPIPDQTGVSGSVEAAASVAGGAVAGGTFRTPGLNAASLLKIPSPAGDKPAETR